MNTVPSSPVDLVLREAERYIGTVEEPRGSNRGLRIDYWLYEAVPDFRPFPQGVKGAPWCAAYISQVGVQALGREAWPVPVTVSCQTLADWADSMHISSPMAHAGDLFVLYYQSKGRYGHVGLVASLLPDNKIQTIEGNRSLTSGTREGYGVFKGVRPITDRVKFIRWATLVSP